jgi:hypothetical protein
MLNKVKHLVIGGEILRCAQNDTIYHLTRERILEFLKDSDDET